ncbi:MAG: aspartyl protease family protein [Planctomycetes bacterium]|nr:aspartyl protease family protein [Planctomycetota bacterium]
MPTPLLLALCLPALLSTQQSVAPRVLRAHSARIDVQDGHNLRKAYWTATPSVAPDVYYAQRSQHARQVSFRSDLDSISFEVEPGHDYDFVVSLDGKDCPTRISTLRESCRRSGAGEIPFTLGRDGKLHIRGRINGSDELDLLFDVGADTLVLYPSARTKKAQLALDGSVLNSGLGGTEKRSTSNDNRLELVDLAWDHELVMAIENQADDADGIVGFNVFEDKLVEFDYEHSLLRILDEPPADLTGFTRGELRFEGSLPRIEALLGDGKDSIRGWLAFDTGFNASVYLARDSVTRAGFVERLEFLGSSRSGGVGAQTIEGAFVLLPELSLGGSVLKDVPINIETSDEGAHHTNLLGMDVLARFDTLLDFQTNTVWWKPNPRFAQPFERPSRMRGARWLLLVLGVCALAGAIVFVRRRARG